MASSSSKRPRRRFIAGAVCPGCGAEDKMFVELQAEETVRGCSQCDFRERLQDVESPPDPVGVQVIKPPS